MSQKIKKNSLVVLIHADSFGLWTQVGLLQLRHYRGEATMSCPPQSQAYHHFTVVVFFLFLQTCYRQ